MAETHPPLGAVSGVRMSPPSSVLTDALASLCPPEGLGPWAWGLLQACLAPRKGLRAAKRAAGRFLLPPCLCVLPGNRAHSRAAPQLWLVLLSRETRMPLPGHGAQTGSRPTLLHLCYSPVSEGTHCHAHSRRGWGLARRQRDEHMPQWCPRHRRAWQGVLDGAEKWVRNGKGPECPGWSVQTCLGV